MARKTHTFGWYAATGGVMLGTICLALLGSTPNAFNRFYDALKARGYSQSYVNLVASCGLVSVNLNFIMGALKDRIGGRLGSLITAALGTLLGSGGYLVMSFISSTSGGPLLCAAFFLVGLGNGACFIVAMSVAVSLSPTGSGPSVAVVGASMGLSVAFTVYAVTVYGDAGGCDDDDHCWASWMRLMAALCLGLQGLGTGLLLFYKEENYPHLSGASDAVALLDGGEKDTINSDTNDVAIVGETTPIVPSNESGGKIGTRGNSPSVVTQHISFWEALVTLRHPYYLFLFAAEFVGFFSAIFILSQASQLWDDFVPHKSSFSKSLGGQILPVFSYFNVVAALAGGSVNDILNRKRICRTSTFLGAIYLFWGLAFVVIGLLAVSSGSSPSHAIQLVFFILLTSDAVLFGVMLVTLPTVLAEEYGHAAFAKIFGLLNLSPAAASFTAPLITNAIFRAAGSYHVVFFTLGGLIFLSGIGLIFLRNTHPFPYFASTAQRLQQGPSP